MNDVEVGNTSDVIYKFETWARVLGWKYGTSCNCWVKNNTKLRRMYEAAGMLDIFEEGLYNASMLMVKSLLMLVLLSMTRLFTLP